MVDMPYNQTKANYKHLIYMNKYDLALNDRQLLICYKTETKRLINI